MTCNCDYCRYLSGDKAVVSDLAARIGEKVIREFITQPKTLDRLMEIVTQKLRQKGFSV